MQGGSGYFYLCSGPTVGSSPNYRWNNLTKSTSGTSHLQVRIEAQDRPDAVLLGSINHSGWSGLGSEEHYSMRFEMSMGETWSMFGPSFYSITEWDKGSYLPLNALDFPEAASYLTNGEDESLRVKAMSSLKGNVESTTVVKSPGIAEGYPDLHGCVITEFGLKINNIIIDHDAPGWTYFTWDVTWEIWGIKKTADINRDGVVNLFDFSILTSSWYSHAGDANWNQLCDIYLPNDGHVNIFDLEEFCDNWLSGVIP